MTDPVFVFGSNLAGRHGKGAALAAYKHHGAIRGQGVGRQGNSYAIPTKDKALKVLPLATIQAYVEAFLAHAATHVQDRFEVTEIGCGLARYTPEQIAPMFRWSTYNVHLPASFNRVLGR
jgi:hypothetical protein